MFKRYRSALWLFLLYTALGLLDFTTYYLDDLARAHSGTIARRFTEEMTGAYAALALFPIVLFVARRFSFARAGRPMAVVAAVAGAFVYSIAHTTLMAISRAILFPLTGQGPYDYGIMLYRYPMEAAKDVVTFAIIYGLIAFFDRLQRAREIEAQMATLQLENLRLQLHPHFLFNTLNAISSVMYEDVAKADAMLAKLSDFLRTVLHSGSVQQVALSEELEVERMYVDIMRTRLDRRLSLNVTVADEARAAIVPFMLLQPLLENSIRHGLPATGGDLNLAIDVRRMDGSTVIDVSDDGVGIVDPKELPRGVGLQNVRARLEGLYGERASFEIAGNGAHGTVVHLAFPFAEIHA
ncbi:MAG: histidine kinase [Candidatus Eremiobacteraeota bacterium]|nr:histidine kinase [Candidatus Eremiobacteraeota bacterium]